MKYPEKIFVYPCDYDDGEPIFAAVKSLSEIGEADLERGPVALYVLQQTSKVNVKRESNFTSLDLGHKKARKG